MTVTNAGYIAGGSAGIFANSGPGASVTNLSTGTIGSTGDDGIGFQFGAGTVVNAGLIGPANGLPLYGVWFIDGGTLTNQLTGTISGGVYGVHDDSDTASVENEGTISGGFVGVGLGGGGTVTNAGTISGSNNAIVLAPGYANRVIVDPGAVFSGILTGGNTIGAAAVSTLELASATSPAR